MSELTPLCWNAGVSLTDRPPFRGCWHACYIRRHPQLHLTIYTTDVDGVWSKRLRAQLLHRWQEIISHLKPYGIRCFHKPEEPGEDLLCSPAVITGLDPCWRLHFESHTCTADSKSENSALTCVYFCKGGQSIQLNITFLCSSGSTLGYTFQLLICSSDKCRNFDFGTVLTLRTCRDVDSHG